ncbi:MAG: hypothetical protein MN733_09845 [Nitrososphaera sp.]|nr:hypothetical protein [Nitrososphaera sp.]MCI0708201.1 hypothetical protein [Ignavibacteriota bacterium]
MKNYIKPLTLWEFMAIRDKGVLPAKAERDVGRAIVALKKRMAKLTPEQRKIYGLKVGENKSCNEKAVAPFRFTPFELQIIENNLRQANANKAIPTDERWLALYDKFVGKAAEEKGNGGTVGKPVTKPKGK